MKFLQLFKATRHPGLTDGQHQQEVSLLRAIGLDAMIYVPVFVSVVISGSLTMLAELVRGTLLFLIEIISYVTLRRSNRGRFAAFEYGIGKIERMISILVGIGLYVSALFTLHATMARIQAPTVLPTSGMILAVVSATANMVINIYCTGDFIRSLEKQKSLIVESQVRSRIVKSVASVVVVIVLVTATWLADPKAATLVDAAGAVFVITFMIITATKLLRESVPDLLDRALPENEQLILLRVLTRYFDDFDHFDAVKSRRSGGHAFIDMALEFDQNMPFHEVNRRCAAIERDLIEAIPDAIVSVVPRVANSSPILTS